MTAKGVIAKTIELLGCDTARIFTPHRMHFMVIGERRNTKNEPGQWMKNGTPYDFDYIAEKVIAKGRTYKALWENIQYAVSGFKVPVGAREPTVVLGEIYVCKIIKE